MTDTPTLDKLYLEWSQLTKARTNLEIDMAAFLRSCRDRFQKEPRPWEGSNEDLVRGIDAVLARHAP